METLKSMLHSLKGKLSMRWKQDCFYTAVCRNPQVLLGCQIILACHRIFWDILFPTVFTVLHL